MSQFSQWDDPNSYIDPGQKPAPSSKIDKFKKAEDETKVGKVEQAVIPKVAGAIESAGKKPIIGKAINLGMSALGFLGEKVVQPLTQGVSSLALTPQAMAAGKGGVTESYRYAQKKAKKISMGQAVQGLVGQVAAPVLGETTSATWLKEDFNIFDQKQRDKAFRDEWSGILFSGATDLALAAFGTKGVGLAMRGTAKKVVGPKRLVTTDDMDKFRTELEDVVAQQALPATQRTQTGLSILVDDAVKETNLTKLAANPLVSETSNPYRTATIISRLDNHQDVADYLLAERGDTNAFKRFFDRRPLEADHLDNYGINDSTPITNFANVGLDRLAPELVNRYQFIINAKKAEDPNFARALDDFMEKARMGVIESYRPGKYAALESIGLGKKKLQTQALYGDLKMFGKDADGGWKTQVYQSRVYDRAIRVIAWTGSGRPQGYINISNPRKFEAANDLLSDLNRLQFLKGPEGAKFKRAMVEQYLDAQSDTQRAIVLGRIEQQVMTKLAKAYGITDMQDITSAQAAIKEMTRWHTKVNQTRQSIKDYAVKNGLIPDEDGGINIQNFLSVSNEAQNIPMLDFRRLETEVIFNARRVAGAGAKVTQGQYFGAVASTTAMNVGQLLDLANMVFSNLNLLRLAYIPKNSMVDPFARASMALESMELVKNAVPGVDNVVHNSGLLGERLKKWVPGSPQALARKQAKAAQFRVEKYSKDLAPKINEHKLAVAKYDSLDASLTKLIAARDKAKAKALKSKDVNVQNKYYELEDKITDLENQVADALDNMERLGDQVNGLSQLINRERKDWANWAKSQGNLTQKKLLGQEEEIIEVNGQTYSIQGLADPNVRGASAYMSEIDTATNFYSASMNSEIARRVRADGSRFVKIPRRDREEYMNALAHIANRQIRNELDLPVGWIMKGEKSDAEILEWMYSPAGKEFRLRIEERYGDDMQKWVSDTREKLYAMYPDEELRKIITERPVTYQEVDSMLYGRTDLLPEIDGPSLKLSDLNRPERILARVSGATDAAWKVLAASENRLVRNPLFLSYTRDEMKVLINAAQRSGIDVSDAVVNNEIRQVAYRKALARVEQTLYSSRRLTNGMYVARYAMSFPLAFFNSQYVALRLMAKNPMNAYWYNSIMQAFDNYEAYEDKDGNTYSSIKDVPQGTPVTVKYPLPFGNKLPDALKPYLDPRGGGIKFNPKQLEFMVADPSVSWFGTVGISELVKGGFFENKSWGKHGEDIALALRKTFGDDVYESSILYGGYPQEGSGYVGTALQTILPGYLGSVLDAAYALRDGGKIKAGASDKYIDEVYTHWRKGYADWVANGRIGQPPTMETAAKSAANMAFIRAIVQFAAPISASFDPVTRAATAYYADLVEAANGDYNIAQAMMEDDWGIDSLALVGSNQKNIAGMAATMNDIKALRNNKDLMMKIGEINTKYAGMLSSGYGDIAGTGSGPNDYSTEIAAIYKRLNFPGGFQNPITQKKTSDELKQDVQARVGWAEYQKAVDWRNSVMYQYGIGSVYETRYETTGIKRQYDEMIKDIEKDFPKWVEDRNNGRKDYWKQTIPAIEAIVDDTKWRSHAWSSGSSKWEEIAFWVSRARQFKDEYNAAINSDERKFALKQQFSQFHHDFLQTASDEFDAFATRWLNNMPELDKEFVVTE
jgi:hypothetical protein